MSFRIPAVVAVLTLLGFAADNPAGAQPQVPARPRSSPFGTLFGPSSPAIPNAGQNQMFMAGPGFNQLGPGLNQFGAAGGQQMLPYGFLPGTVLTPVPGATNHTAVFNSLGRWYSQSYGHWYPNGVRSGGGVLTNTGGFGGAGGFGGLGYGGYGTTGTGTMPRPQAGVNPGGAGAGPVIGVVPGGGFRR